MKPYRNRPAAYAREVLRLASLTPDQVEILQSLTTAPFKTLVKAGHEVGKSLVAAVAVCWWFDTRPQSIVLTTAPKYSQVRDILWKEVRRLRTAAGLPNDFPGPKMPRMETSPDHFAVGLTANTAESFQGHHGPAVLVVVDEAVGVMGEIWEACHTMAHAFLAIFNPTDTTSTAYLEETQTERPYTVKVMSQLDHPNVAMMRQAGGTLRTGTEVRAWYDGRELPIPYAVKPWEVDANIRAWSSPIRPEERKATDIEWPLLSGQWWRPGPLAEARILGRWPSQGTSGVWADADWLAAEAGTTELPPPSVLPRIGLDVAVFGDDWTAFHVRVGNVSLAHETYNGRDTDHTIGAAVQLAERWAAWLTGRREKEAAAVSKGDIVFVVDSGGVGSDLEARMHAAGLSAISVNASTPAMNQRDYPNKRSELWFNAAERARMGSLSLALLPADLRRKLRQQAMAPAWKLDAAGRKVVEPKDKTKEKIGRSPDDMDGLNLSYYEGATVADVQPIEQEESGARRRGLFGMGRD